MHVGADRIDASDDDMMRLNRRQFLAGSIASAITTASRAMIVRAQTAPATQRVARFRISASDWMMLKRQTPGALTRAAECGLDGVETDMGPLGKRPTFENKLLEPQFLSEYFAKAKELNLAISGLAMSAFYGQAFGKREKADEFCATWIELMPRLGTSNGFLPIIGIDDAGVRAKTVAHLKAAGALAEQAGVVLGLSTSLNADANCKFLEEIGSPAVRIAYNCGEAVDDGRDVLKEIRILGKQRIAQVIPTLSDGVLLKDDPRLDVSRLKALLDEIDWSGWLVLQRSRDKNKARDVKYNFSANAAYLKSVFQS